MSTFIKFIAQQLIESPFELSIFDNEIVIQKNGALYKEPVFDTDSKFDKNDLDSLKEVSTLIDEGTDLKNFPTDFGLLKNWYLITHEKYFKDDLVLDRYGRVGQENLNEEFLTILKVPIADVLKRMFSECFSVQEKISPVIYLTCDFDILNVWDVWSIKDFIREVFYSIKKPQLRKLIETVGSYFLSRKLVSYNGYLNEKMYSYGPSFVNVGFFIALPDNKKYDGEINYTNKLVDRYIKKLKSKNVIFGLHTNYNTIENPESILKQQEAFQDLFNSKAKLNRHHYLRFQFPDYLETLEKGCVDKDFSLYFPESMLFRAGSCSSYFAWNEKEMRPFKTQLIPTTIMDGTFSDYLNCDYKTALALAKTKIDLTMKYSDSLVLLWHNRSTYKYCNIENNYHPELIENLIEYLNIKSREL